MGKMLEASIESLRDRPHEERETIAAAVAIIIAAILIVAWLVSFFAAAQHTVPGASANTPPAPVAQQQTPQTSPASSSVADQLRAQLQTQSEEGTTSADIPWPQE